MPEIDAAGFASLVLNAGESTDAYTLALSNGAAADDFDAAFFADAAVRAEGSGVEYGDGKILLTGSVTEASVVFTTDSATLTISVMNYAKPESTDEPAQGGFAYRFFGESVSIADILLANAIDASDYAILSLSDGALVSEKDGVLTAAGYFDAVTLTLAFADGTEAEIVLSNPAPIQAGETVAVEGVGAFAAREAVPFGTVLVVNEHPQAPEGIVLPGSGRKGGPQESEPVFFDISLVDPQGNKVQTGASVTIATQIALPAEEGKETKVLSVNVYHITEKGEAEPLEAAFTLAEGRISSVSFATDGFSLFAVTYTVEFIDHGVSYSIAGGGVLSLRALLTALDVQDVTIEQIESVRFSNEKLVLPVKIDTDTTAAALKEALGPDLPQALQIGRKADPHPDRWGGLRDCRHRRPDRPLLYRRQGRHLRNHRHLRGRRGNSRGRRAGRGGNRS